MTNGKNPHSLTRLEVGLLLLLVLLAVGARLLPGPRTVDDAYITFRYARNLLQGDGLVYNPGERVLGTTTPLYALLLSGLAGASGWRDFPALAVGVNALAGGASTALLYFLGRRLAGRRVVGAAAALLWAVTPHSVTFAVGGMETELTIALLLGTFLAHLSGRSRAMAVCAALAFLARPDTLIASGPLLLDTWLARRRLPWTEGLLAAGLLAPWLLLATLYYGSPLPASLAAKSITYRLPSEAALIRLVQHYATPFFESQVLPPMGVVLAFAVYVGLAVLGALAAWRANRRSAVVALYPLLYAAVFALVNPLLFRWYLAPPMPVYILLILSGAWRVMADLVAGIWSLGNIHYSKFNKQTATSFLFALATLAALLLTLNAWTLRPDHGPERPAPRDAFIRLELLYQQAATIVNEQSQPGDTLCAGDIGVLGYVTGLHILDTVGLVTPQTSAYYPADPAIYVINYAIPADLVLALDPDFIVILEVYGRRGLLPDARFQARYRLLEKLETDMYGSDGMLIWERQ